MLILALSTAGNSSLTEPRARPKTFILVKVPISRYVLHSLMQMIDRRQPTLSRTWTITSHLSSSAIRVRELRSIMSNIVSTFPNSITSLCSFCLSTCHSLTSTPFGFSWKTSKLERLQYVQPEESHYRREREGERERTRERVNGDRGMIFGQLYNWLLIQCSLHIRGSPSPLTLTDQMFSQCGNSGNTNKSFPQWKCILTTDSLVLSFPFIPPLCLPLLLASFPLQPPDSPDFHCL